MSSYFKFLDSSNSENVKEILILKDEISSIEKMRVLVGTTHDRKKVYHHAILFHTKHEMSKKSTSIQLAFPEAEDRDRIFQEIQDTLQIDMYNVQWKLV